MDPPVYITCSQEAVSKANTPTNLKRHKPNAFHGIANEEKILKAPKRGHVYSHVHESHPNQTLV
jgi:hypothetical protein